MLPLLQEISDGREHSNHNIETAFAKKYGLTEAECQQMLPSGKKVFPNRVAWAKASLKKAGLVESTTRGCIRITEEGGKVLAKPPDRIDIPFLKQFPAYDWHGPPKPSDDSTAPQQITSLTPEESLERSYQTIQKRLADQLLERVKECSPAFFERLVLDLLLAMGYGGSRADAGRHVGRTGDGGIDGIIKEDALGLDVVCIQAKRWTDNVVGSPEVTAFAGGMGAHKARKGVLLTTSSFSKSAEDYVNKIELKIVLINGRRLAELMIEHNIGVENAMRYDVKKVDTDYFAEEEGE
jgi:restriction system protein